MSSHIKKPSPILLKQLRQIMNVRKLFNPEYQLSQMYSVLKKFIEIDLVEYISWVDGQVVREVVQGVLAVVEKQMLKQGLLMKVWMKVFVVHGVFQLVIKNNHQIGEKLFPFMIQKLSQYHVDLQTISNPINHHNHSRSNSLFSRSVSKIKRSLSSNSIKQLFVSTIKKSQLLNTKFQEEQNQNQQFNITSVVKSHSIQKKRNNNLVNTLEKKNNDIKNEQYQRQGQLKDHSNFNKNINTNKQTYQQNSIEKALSAILHQYIKYLQKLLTNWSSLNASLSPYVQRGQLLLQSPSIKTSNNHQQQQSTTLTTQIVWKLLNYFHILQKMCKEFHKICNVIQEYQTYMYGTLNFIADDLLFLYNPIVDFIMQQIKSIKWEEIIKIIGSAKDKRSLEKFSTSNNNNKQSFQHQPLTKKLPAQIFQHITQLKTMIDQLGHANEVVLYIFNGYYHSKYLLNKRRPRSFISLNDNRFDVVFHVFKRMQQKQQKGRRNVMMNDLSLLNTRRESSVVSNAKNSNNNSNIKTSLIIPTTTTTNKHQSKNNPQQNSKLTNTNTNMGAVRYKANKLKQMLVVANSTNPNNNNNNKLNNIAIVTAEQSARENHLTQ